MDVITTSRGLDLTVRVVLPGMPYGNRPWKTHNAAPVVEFFDRRFDLDKDENGETLGEFVSRFPLDNLNAARNTLEADGLKLKRSTPYWSIDPDAMKQTFATLDTQAEG